jgi:rhodanese-related sulfurtransferase
MRITLFVSLLKVCFIVLIIIGLASTAVCTTSGSQESPAEQPSDNLTENSKPSPPVAGSESVTGSEGSATKAQIGELTAKELASRLTSGEKLVLIDVLPIAQYKEGHIKGAIWGDNELLRTETETYLNRLGIKKTDTIVLICETGAKSANTVPFLTKAGYQEVYNLKEGNVGWIRAGFDLIKE